MNEWFFTGNIVKGPEMLTSKNNKPYCTFTIATKGGWSKDAPALFKNCVAWTALDYISKYCHKGDTVAVCGVLEANNYVDTNGNKHYGDVVKVEKIEFLRSPKSKQQNSGLSDNQGSFIGLDGADVPLDDDLPF